MDWGWTAWFEAHAGALSALAALGTLGFTIVLVLVTRTQAKIATRQADIADKQVTLQAEIHKKEGPVLLLHFAGFQSRPQDPRNDMLWLMVGIGNEGRRDVRVTHLEIEILDPKKEGYHSHALFPRQQVQHGEDSRGNYEPKLPASVDDAFDSRVKSILQGETYQSTVRPPGGLIKAHDAESFYVALPGGEGYEKWRRVRLRVAGIGVDPATKELDWDLSWLRGSEAT